MNSDISDFERSIDYTFGDKKLLLTALTHSSYANEQGEDEKDNERLEFLGDAVLELVSSDCFFHLYPAMSEGELTKLRASLVCEMALDYSARAIGLDHYIRLGKGEEKTGGRSRKSIISDALEAVIGAIYLDGGIDKAKEFICRFVINDIEKKELFIDSKTKLQEIMQADEKEPIYVLVDESGPDHCKEFVMEVVVDGVTIGRGLGRTKKLAQQEAAKDALIALREKNVS